MLSNVPPALTQLRLQANRSYSLGVDFVDADGVALDLTGCTVTLEAKELNRFGGATVLTNVATAIDLANGQVRHDIPAADMDLATRAHDWSITLETTDDYLATVIAGELEVVEAIGAPVVAEGFAADPAQTIEVKLRSDRVIVKVRHLEYPALQVGVVTTLAAGTPAGASLTGAWPLQTLHLSIPAGADGQDGDDGIDGNDGAGVPIGGTASQILAKVDATDYNTEWVDPPSGGGSGVPVGGTAGQHLAKVSATDGDVTWEDPPTVPPAAADDDAIPAGGTAGQRLEKVDGTDYNLQWGDDPAPAADDGAIPAGGTAGQRLEKVDGTDYNLAWGDDPAPAADDGAIPAGGTAGQGLAKVDATDYNLQWTDFATAGQFTDHEDRITANEDALASIPALEFASFAGTLEDDQQISNAVMFQTFTGANYTTQPRPTARTDIMVIWRGDASVGTPTNFNTSIDVIADTGP